MFLISSLKQSRFAPTIEHSQICIWKTIVRDNLTYSRISNSSILFMSRFVLTMMENLCLRKLSFMCNNSENYYVVHML